MTAPLDEKGLLDRICHKEQIGIWANEVLTALSLGDFLREEWSFDDTVDAEREIEAQLRSIIASAIPHPEYDLMAKITAAEAQVLRLTEENEALRKERDGKEPDFRDKVALGATDAEILRFRDSYPNPAGGSKVFYRYTIEQARYRYADAVLSARSALKENAL